MARRIYCYIFWYTLVFFYSHFRVDVSKKQNWEFQFSHFSWAKFGENAKKLSALRALCFINLLVDRSACLSLSLACLPLSKLGYLSTNLSIYLPIWLSDTLPHFLNAWLSTCLAGWRSCTPPDVRSFSAILYVFLIGLEEDESDLHITKIVVFFSTWIYIYVFTRHET